MRLCRLFALLFVLAPAGACSMVVDASDIDQGCADGEKSCADKCVAISDPAYGCEIDSCSPCPFDRAIPICDDFLCIPSTCLEGFCGEKCDINMLTSETNCGGCDRPEFVCDTENGETCQNGECMPK